MLNNIYQYIIAIGIGLCMLLTFACQKDIADNNVKHDFFPMPDSGYRIYKVSETRYALSRSLSDTDTFSMGGERYKILKRAYYKMELFDGTDTMLIDSANHTYRIVSRWQIHSAQSIDSLLSNFEFSTYDELWTAYKNTERVERVEGNTRYVVLNFPILKNKIWDGNAFNNLGNEFYRSVEKKGYFYATIDTNVDINNTNFEHCLVVNQIADTLSTIDRYYTYEIYSPNIGLVKRYSLSDIKITKGIDLPSGYKYSTDSKIDSIILVDYKYFK